MNPYRMAPPPRRWDPKLSPLLVRLTRSFRNRIGEKEHRLSEIVVKGADHVRTASNTGAGVLITPNHSSHADPFSMYAAADKAGVALQFMATWHVFSARSKIGQWFLQKHGVFSVDREGTDLRAFKMAVGVLQAAKSPLVIFPEGEIYHCNDKTTPFREGPATIALSAARRSDRKIVVIPCALKYEYVNDPMPRLLQVMSELEQKIHWRPKSELSLPDRIYAFGQAMMALKELEFYGEAKTGSITNRTAELEDDLLKRIEERHGAAADGSTRPERIKHLRRGILEKLQAEGITDADREQLNCDLDDVFLVVQLFSYPGNYVAESPTTERLAETLDKFEEDIAGLETATIKGDRKVTITFDAPIEVSKEKSRTAGRDLTSRIEERVQAMLDEMSRA